MDKQILVSDDELDYGTNQVEQVPVADLRSRGAQGTSGDGLDETQLGNGSVEQEEETQPEGTLTTYMVLLSLLSAIGGFLFGYDTGVVSGAMIALKDKFQLSYFWQELVVSATIGAAAVFAIVGGFLNDWLGRKPVILIASVIFTVGSVVMAISDDKGILLVGRLIVGCGIGLASMCVPMYIAESSPAHLRGKLVLVNNLFITGGQVVAAIVDGIFFSDKVNGWRYMLGLAGVPSVIQMIGFAFMPESPRWLVSKGRHGHARKVLVQIRGHNQVDKELQEIESGLEESVSSARPYNSGPVLFQMLRYGPTRRALLVGCLLQFFQQLAGINTVMYYSATIISMAGVRDDHIAVWLAAVTAAVNFIFTFVGLYLIDRIGRRPLMLGSLVGILLSLLILALGFTMNAQFSPAVTFEEYAPTNVTDPCDLVTSCNSCIINPKCGFCYVNDIRGRTVNGSCLPVTDISVDYSSFGRCEKPESSQKSHGIWAYDYCPTHFAWIVTSGLILYLVFFAPGMGPVPWTVNSEVYPTWARSTGMGMATSVNWICNLIVSISFLSLTEALTKQGTYFLYCGLVVIALVFVGRFVPETRGRTLEQVEDMFRRPWC